MARRTPLDDYRKKRDFTKSPEPRGQRQPAKPSTALAYVIQKHEASHLHYDLRLELDGMLKSWAIPKGPSLNPLDKRLAVHVEDHPLEYGSFEGIIPEGEYGGGTVMLWDRGTWEPLGDAHKGFEKGALDFELHGARLKGRWHLVRLKRADKHDNWLLIKGDDSFADPDGTAAVEKYMTSVSSKRTMEKISKAGVVDEDAPNRSPSQKEPVKKKPRVEAWVEPPPEFVSMQLATLVRKPPAGNDWIHEIKFDGYRIMSRLEEGEIRCITRGEKDWTQRFSEIAKQLSELDVSNALLDGEIVAVDSNGHMSFHALQQALKEGRQNVMHYYIFDLLFLNGQEMRKKTLLERKQALQELLPEDRGQLHYSEHFDQPGPDVFRQACRIALEGIVSKRKDASYVSGRSKSWLKSKCLNEQELVIGGFTYQPKQKELLAALAMGYYQNGDLIYAGKVGTGYTHDEANELVKKLKPLAIDKPPFKDLKEKLGPNVVWVQPKLVAQVFFNEWTDSGLLRQPSFQGLREDKAPREVTRETEAEVPQIYASPHKTVVAGITISNPDKLMYPESGITKLELAEYYEAIANYMLPYVAGRPISLVRCPDGREKDCIFQRHPAVGMSPHIKPVSVTLNEPNEFLTISDVKGLVALAQMAVLEIHTWGGRAKAIETPDRIVFDLDPAEDVVWANVRKAALELRDRLEEIGLKSFVLATGGKGLHVVAPIAEKYGWDDVKEFARLLAKSMAHDDPSRFTINMRKEQRVGRIYVDYLRNGKGSSFIAPYSTRKHEGAPVATPLEWDELTQTKNARPFDIRTILTHLKETGGAWGEMLKLKQPLPL
jgi:bifunctional non-homologous end joining protein LigD